MPTIVCPDCGQHARFDTVQRAADEFCTNCDYPLFWVQPARPELVSSNGELVSRRRLPGTGGKLTIGHQLCPSCGELNPLTAWFCSRCGADLDPKPVPAPAPPPVIVVAPQPQPVVVVELPPDRGPWLVLALVVLAAVAAVLLSIL